MQTAFSVLSFHFTLRETFSLSYIFFLLLSLFPTTYYYEVIFHLHFPALQKQQKIKKRKEKKCSITISRIPGWWKCIQSCLIIESRIWFIDGSFIQDDKSLNNSTIIFLCWYCRFSRASRIQKKMNSRR